MGGFSRRDAETQRVLLFVSVSPRLCASAGIGFRYCVVEFLFHCGVRGGAIGGGCPGRFRVRSWGKFPAETLRRREFDFVFHFLCVSVSLRELALVKPNQSESQRMILDQRTIVCAPAGCSLMGLAKTPGYCFRAGKNTNAQTQATTPISLRKRLAFGGA